MSAEISLREAVAAFPPSLQNPRPQSSAPPPISLAHDTRDLAVTYDQTSSHQFNHGKLLIEALDIKPGDHVLDVGAGTGRLGAHVAAIVGPFGKVVGIDPLPLRIEIARGREIANFETRVGQAEELRGFADQSFDVIYLNSVFHWIKDKPKALAEFFRVLKPGGRLGLNTQDPDHPHEFRHFVRRAIADAGLTVEHLSLQPALGIRAAGLEILAKAAGFTGFRSELKTLVDLHDDTDSLVAWARSSSFGNFLAVVAPAERELFLRSLGRLLEARHTSRGIRLERYLVFATARKPA